jgi:sialate O-acetylesterase
MELPMRRVSWVYPQDIKNSENPNIRQFYVPRKYEFNHPYDDLPAGNWKKANPTDVLDFSATAYFFAKMIYDQYRIPVGIINSAYGGSPVEAWLSEPAIIKFPEYQGQLGKYKDHKLIEQILEEDNQRISNWYNRLHQNDKGYKDPRNPWYDPSLDAGTWPSINLPGYWEDVEPGHKNGVTWFRKTVHLAGSLADKPSQLILGRIIDSDSVFVNGKFIGSTGYQYPPRRYNIPAQLLTEGENIIVVRVVSESGKGGFVPDKPYVLITGEDTIDLKGTWKYMVGAEMEPLAGRTFFNAKPAGLYNAMISPLTNYAIKGVIWYQGESNVERPEDYYVLFTTLINDWREKWQQKDLPFLYVQLPNFQIPATIPSESNWALLREAQLKSLSVPQTGMAVTIDLGEWNDIHPLNKKDVGYRLSRVAKKAAYGDTASIHCGPLFQSYKIEGNRIILSFSNADNGLMIKGNDELKQFSVSGPDGKFLWAKAEIAGRKVIVWNDHIPDPVAVRYAWADNPEGANLYNKEGLPASPFRTDDWDSDINIKE